LVERYQETFDDEVTELAKQVDWAFAISMAIMSALLLRVTCNRHQYPFSEKVLLSTLFASIIFGLAPKFWRVRYRFSKPTDTPVRFRLGEMNSPTLQEGFFNEMDFRARRSASFEVSVNLNLALGLGKKVPTKALHGADESVEALRSLLNSLTWKRWFYRCS
jgi:hypothetical protein